MQVNFEPVRTYATKANAVKAVEENLHPNAIREVTWFIHSTEDGRFFPVFVGERALQRMIHFKFCVVA